MKKQGLIVVISGPTGVGKTTITNELLKRLPRAAKVVTTTSREPRKNEKNGVDYYFITKSDFETRIKAGSFIEYTYIENRDVYYGSRKKDFELLLDDHDYVLFVPTEVGLQEIKKRYPNNYVSLFLMFDEINDITTRIKRRQPGISDEELQERLQNAQDRVTAANQYDYVIINKEGALEKTVTSALNLIKTHRLDKST